MHVEMELETPDENIICHLRPYTGSFPAAYNSAFPTGSEIHGDDTREAQSEASAAPASTEVAAACQWCCHPFDTTAVMIPTRIVDNTYVVTGRYCSFPCAAAAIFDEHLDSNTAWTRYQMLNDMSFKAGNGMNTIVRAPPRRALKLFGGDMDINEFRRSGPVETIIERTPPMIAEQPRLEEVSSNHLYRDAFVPIDDDRIKKYQVRLQRTKPKRNYMSTLDYVLEGGTPKEA